MSHRQARIFMRMQRAYDKGQVPFAVNPYRRAYMRAAFHAGAVSVVKS